MGKKPADQRSKHPNGDVDNDEDIDLSLNDGEGDDDEGEDDDDDENDDDDLGTGGKGESKKLEDLLEGFGDKLMGKVTSEIDRRINGALNKRKTKDDDRNGEDKNVKEPVSDVRSARLAYREAISSEISFLSSEERSFGNELGRLIITSKAQAGFEDPDVAGEDAARLVAEKLKEMRSFYSKRTKAVLQRQGALKEQRNDQNSGGSTSTVIGKTKGAELAKDIRSQLTGR